MRNVVSTSLLAVVALVSADQVNRVRAAENAAQKSSSPRTATIRVSKGTQDEPARQLLVNTAMTFQPGHRAKLQVAGLKDGARSLKIAAVIDTVKDQQTPLYKIDVKFVDDSNPKKPVILASPTVVTVEGRPATVAIGSTADLLQIDILVQDQGSVRGE